jgi:hypothetical protein
MVVTDGLPYGKALGNAGALFADKADLNQVDPINYPNELVPDPNGRLALPALIPGATYRFIDRSTGPNAVLQVRKEFKVEPGQTLDLGDILIEKASGIVPAFRRQGRARKDTHRTRSRLADEKPSRVRDACLFVVLFVRGTCYGNNDVAIGNLRDALSHR